MTTKTVGAEKSLSKSDLEAWLEDAEANFGPVTEINVAEGGTVATLNRDADSPATKATIILGKNPCPQPSKEVCKGRAWIGGVVMDVVVCR